MIQSKADEVTRIHPCPICRKPVAWNTSSPQRPLCSRRCQLIDLGGWASESYQIPIEQQELEADSLDGEERE